MTSDPEILGGEPVLIGTRLRLETVLKCYEDGATPEEVFEWYPGASLEVLQRIRSVFRPGVAVSTDAHSGSYLELVIPAVRPKG